MIAVIAAHLNLHQYWDNPDQRSFMNSGHDIDREGSRKQKTIKLEIGAGSEHLWTGCYGVWCVWFLVCDVSNVWQYLKWIIDIEAETTSLMAYMSALSLNDSLYS